MNGNAITVSNSNVDERFSYNELANGFSAIKSVFEASRCLRSEVESEYQLDKAATAIIRAVCNENTSLQQDVPSGLVGEGSLEIGRLFQRIDDSSLELDNVLRNECPHYDGDFLSSRVVVNNSEPYFILISQPVLNKTTTKLIRRAFYSTLKAHPGSNFVFIDLVGGGNSFPFAQEFVSTFPKRSGGHVFSNEGDLNRVINELSTDSGKAISMLGDVFSSAAEYNASNKKEIARRFVAIAIGEVGYQVENAIKELATLVKNRAKNNTDFIVVGQSDKLNVLSSISDLHIREAQTGLFAGRNGEIEFGMQLHNPIDEVGSSGLIDAMKAHGKVDTLFNANEGIFPDYLSMDSSEAIRIPFALDEDGDLQYFEIGGAAATHALISGKTGSGKSVALHTLIMQIICNYHPDDVEIWAIDYKAVEFDWYIQHKAPHFRVIARDSSDEFSYSLLDLIDEEYKDRQRKFLDENVNDIGQYRQKMGQRSMSRIIVFIDEFQVMTQAVQAYSGEKNYRKLLENHLRLARAMGISFVFCSQTVASGLGGLTDAARDQIACRLCLQQQSIEEIRETLSINGPDESGVIKQVENLRRGQAVYKRVRWQNEHSPDGKAYETKLVNIIFMSQRQRAEAIEKVRQKIGSDYRLKDETIVRGETRNSLRQKLRHPVMAYLSGQAKAHGDYIEWYPAAPASLADSYCVKLEDSAGSNMLVVGENDELRDSIATHSVISLLSDPRNKVVATFINEDYPDRKRMIEQLRRVISRRFALNVGIGEALGIVSRLRRIKPDYTTRTVYLWYGLDRLENEMFLAAQDDEVCPADSETIRLDSQSPQEAIDELTSFLAEFDVHDSGSGQMAIATSSEELSFSDCKAILRQAFERGPENNQYHLVFFNNRKSMKKSGVIDLSDFDNRVGTQMSSEDAFDLFGTSQAMNKANDSTVIYSSGVGRGVPLRPYLMPLKEDYAFYNKALAYIDTLTSE